jgi:hypothetical protein
MLFIISDFHNARMANAADFKLDDLQEISRMKNLRKWLEPKNGVGATTVRGYVKHYLVKKWCVLCGTNSAVCLGKSCMGKKVIPEVTHSNEDFIKSSGSITLPGYPEGVKDQHSTLTARKYTVVPRMKIAAFKFPCYLPKITNVIKSVSVEGKSKVKSFCIIYIKSIQSLEEQAFQTC